MQKGDKIFYEFIYYTYSNNIDEYGDREVIDECISGYGIILTIQDKEALCLMYSNIDTNIHNENEIYIDEINCRWLNTSLLNTLNK